MLKPIFEYTSYIEYLQAALETSGESRGLRSKLAKKLGCQSSFISQVLVGRVHLSFEYALTTSEFLNHTDDERRFFMLLVQKGKAGTRELEGYYQNELDEISRARENIQNRLKVEKVLSVERQATYYSVWYHSAIHILTAFKDFHSPQAISTYLHLDLNLVNESLQFLVGAGLVQEEKGRYRIGEQRIHLDQSSPLLPRHHANWRMRAIEAVDRKRPEDLHFSGVYGLSRADAQKLKTMLLEFLEKANPIAVASREEFPYALLLDLFRI